MNKTITLLLSLTFFLCFSALSRAAEYDHTVEVRGMTFSWKIDGDNLNVKLDARTTGWVAVGFNPQNAMEGANLLLGYVERGKVTVSDEYGTRENEHKPDVEIGGVNNVTNISGKESGRNTEIRFTIPLDSGDKADGVIKTDQFIPVAMSYSARRDSFLTKHLYRTRMMINLGTGESKEYK